MTLGSRILSLVALAALCSIQATPVAALSIESHIPRGLTHQAHDALAKRKRSNKGKRCKPRPAPSSAPSSSPSPSPSPSHSSAAHQSSPAATPSSSPSANNNGGSNFNLGPGKGALAWANDNEFLDKWSGVKTLYTWSPKCPSDAKSLGITCCPMIWGWDQVSDWQANVMNTSPPCVMGVNEPEIAGQSNMDAASGVQLFRTYVTPMKKKGATIVSPATTSDPPGKKWMQDFYNQCGSDDCGVDLHACHWYDVDGDKLIAYLKDLHDTFQKPMWLSEFACQNFNNPNAPCGEGGTWAFEQKVVPFFQQTEWLIKFSAFGAMQNMQGVDPANQLMDSNGNPNALAHAYYNI